MDRLLLIPATFCFLLVFTHTMIAFGAGKYRHSLFNLVAIAIGFVFQTGFLMLRGEMIRRCPLTNPFEVLMFLNWSMLLLYLLVGPAYRLSLLGAFTTPLVFVLQVTAFLMPIDHIVITTQPPSPWLEMHAALSIISYGAFALAGVAGVMFLVQERQLKTHQLHPLFYHLPPISELAVAIRRLIFTGVLLLTVGLLAGFAVGSPTTKVVWGVAMWLLYAVILLLSFGKKLSARRVAIWAVVAFGGTLVSLWWVSLFTGGHV
jgi:ABC-type uncharacterized transport system permease subunit